jgi:hypothetical protein
MKYLILLLFISIGQIESFKMPEINLKNTLYDLMVKNNLKEFIVGFFGVKDEPECKE